MVGGSFGSIGWLRCSVSEWRFGLLHGAWGWCREMDGWRWRLLFGAGLSLGAGDEGALHQRT